MACVCQSRWHAAQQPTPQTSSSQFQGASLGRGTRHTEPTERLSGQLAMCDGERHAGSRSRPFWRWPTDRDNGAAGRIDTMLSQHASAQLVCSLATRAHAIFSQYRCG